MPLPLVVLVVVVVVVLVVLLALFFGAVAVFDFAAVEVLALFADFAALVGFEDLPLPDEPPAVLVPAAAFLPPPSPSSKSPTASATTLIAVNAAPVAAPVRISPAASLTFSNTGDEALLVDFFAPDFDFAEVEAFDFAGADDFAADFAVVELFAAVFDFAGVALFTVVFLLSFFAAIFNHPLIEFTNCFVNSI